MIKGEENQWRSRRTLQLLAIEWHKLLYESKNCFILPSSLWGVTTYWWGQGSLGWNQIITFLKRHCRVPRSIALIQWSSTYLASLLCIKCPQSDDSTRVFGFLFEGLMACLLTFELLTSCVLCGTPTQSYSTSWPWRDENALKVILFSCRSLRTLFCLWALPALTANWEKGNRSCWISPTATLPLVGKGAH